MFCSKAHSWHTVGLRFGSVLPQGPGRLPSCIYPNTLVIPRAQRAETCPGQPTRPSSGFLRWLCGQGPAPSVCEDSGNSPELPETLG